MLTIYFLKIVFLVTQRKMARHKIRDNDAASTKSSATGKSKNKKAKLNNEEKTNEFPQQENLAYDLYDMPNEGNEIKLDKIPSSCISNELIVKPKTNATIHSSNAIENTGDNVVLNKQLNSCEVIAVNALIGRPKTPLKTVKETSTLLKEQQSSGPTTKKTFYSPNRSSASTGQIDVKHSNIKKTKLFKSDENDKDEETSTKPPALHIEVMKKICKNQKEEDSMSLHDDDNDDSSLEVENFTKFHKKTQDAHNRGKYNSLAQAHIFSINNYCRDSLWRRAKFVNDRQLGTEFYNICKHLNIKAEDNHDKYVDICMLVNTNMNYRRSYSTKCIRDTLTGTFLT